MIKRIIDILITVIALSLLFPFILILAILIRIKLGSPILFRQVRPGLHQKPFEMIKFRTMTNKKDKNGILLSDAERLTRFGKILRSTSLDELPELWNVLKGEMSLVGPRPLLIEYLPLYTSIQNRRHDVKPGITGWAQINGRNAITWEQKFDLDVWYVNNRSIWLDIKILFLTPKKIVKKEGITQVNNVTVSPFKGTPHDIRKLAIIGAGGHGRVVGDAAAESGLWDDIVFFDDTIPKITQNGDWKVIGTTDDFVRRKSEFSGVIVAIGDNRSRLEKQTYLEASGCTIATIIHPKSVISRYASIGKGTVVFAGAIINPYVTIGLGVIVNTGATIDHDCQIQMGAHISPGAHISGGVKVGRETWIGVGASVKNKIEIGDNIVVGAGAVVVSHLRSQGTYVGVPAVLYLKRSSTC